MTRERFSNILIVILALDILLFFLVPLNESTQWFFGVLIVAPYALAIAYITAMWKHKKRIKRESLEQKKQ